MIYQYKYKFYLNASHFIKLNNKNGQIHSHCFELVIDIASLDTNNFTLFNNIEKKVEDILSVYQNKLLNDVPPFDTINPTIENICEYFKCIFSETLLKLGWVLLTIEMSETPTRTYVLNVVDEINNQDFSNHAEDNVISKIYDEIDLNKKIDIESIIQDNQKDNKNEILEKKEKRTKKTLFKNKKNKIDKTEKQKQDKKVENNSIEINEIKVFDFDKLEEFNDKEEKINVINEKNNNTVTITKKEKKIDNENFKDDYDYEIPEELMHYDFQ